MGAKLAAYFDKADQKGGVAAKVKLAMLTKMAKDKAITEPDSDANIKLFDEAFAKL